MPVITFMIIVIWMGQIIPCAACIIFCLMKINLLWVILDVIMIVSVMEEELAKMDAAKVKPEMLLILENLHLKTFA